MKSWRQIREMKVFITNKHNNKSYLPVTLCLHEIVTQFPCVDVFITLMKMWACAVYLTNPMLNIDWGVGK